MEQKDEQRTEEGHSSVLLKESIEGLALLPDDIVVDATIGGAGHFKEILSELGPKGMLIGIDADADAIERAKEVLKEQSGDVPQAHLVNDNFRNLGPILNQLNVTQIGKSFFDLGWSSFHLTAGRGFSFQTDESLLMTYGDPHKQETAADVVNSYTEKDLADVLYELGEERFSRRIAEAIIEARQKYKIERTSQLVAIVSDAVPAWYRHQRIHPATKTFQALRMQVNGELSAIQSGVSAAIERTRSKGRVAVITFHSIEDRIVKNMFRDEAKKGVGKVITKKPIVPSSIELSRNPRARSAKLRIFEHA